MASTRVSLSSFEQGPVTPQPAHGGSSDSLELAERDVEAGVAESGSVQDSVDMGPDTICEETGRRGFVIHKTIDPRLAFYWCPKAQAARVMVNDELAVHKCVQKLQSINRDLKEALRVGDKSAAGELYKRKKKTRAKHRALVYMQYDFLLKAHAVRSLDSPSRQSLDSFTDWAETKYPRGFDVLDRVSMGDFCLIGPQQHKLNRWLLGVPDTAIGSVICAPLRVKEKDGTTVHNPKWILFIGHGLVFFALALFVLFPLVFLSFGIVSQVVGICLAAVMLVLFAFLIQCFELKLEIQFFIVLAYATVIGGFLYNYPKA